MRFKLDENLPASICQRLRSLGHDAVTVSEENLVGKSDAEVLAAASSEDRVLISMDLGFADIREYTPGSHAGIVVLRLVDQRWEAISPALDNLLAADLGDLLSGGLAVVDEARVRLRPPRVN